VLLNGRHHAARSRGPAWLDPCSSASSFTGWCRPCALLPGYKESEPILATADPTTWLLRIGWRRQGALSPDEVPGSP
jgi:hypothetical protein